MPYISALQRIIIGEQTLRCVMSVAFHQDRRYIEVALKGLSTLTCITCNRSVERPAKAIHRSGKNMNRSLLLPKAG